MIRDRTTGKVIADKHLMCSSLWSKARGLMFRLKAVPMLFSFNRLQRNSLHMWFVFFPIDVLYLDAEQRVVEMKERFMPFAFYTPKRMSMYVIELPTMTIKDKMVSIGDEIEWDRSYHFKK